MRTLTLTGLYPFVDSLLWTCIENFFLPAWIFLCSFWIMNYGLLPCLSWIVLCVDLLSGSSELFELLN